MMTACSTHGPEPSLATVSGRPDSVELNVYTGTCNAGDLEVTVVEESDTEVVLRVSGGRGTTDDCADGVTAELSNNLGDRTVRDARTGDTMVVALSDLVWKRDGNMYVIVRGGLAQWTDCLMSSLRYNRALDELDP